jgi:uncharacterized protein
MKVFADTGYFIALANPRDQWHAGAVKALRPEYDVVTSSLVVNETISLLQARGFFSAALEFLREIRKIESIQIVYADPVIQTEAWDLFARWGSAGANAVDCVSFAIMRRMGCKKALTFDKHFRAAGFQTLSI